MVCIHLKFTQNISEFYVQSGEVRVLYFIWNFHVFLEEISIFDLTQNIDILYVNSLLTDILGYA